MLTLQAFHWSHQRGVGMIEVLVTIVILAFGLLGLAALHLKIQTASVETYQRAQAVLLLAEMKERIKANRGQASAYASSGILGTNDGEPENCDAIAVGPDRDQCIWSNALKGASETNSYGNAGAMIGARGCITEVRAPNPTPGICLPGVYQITVAWQGMYSTKAPAATCGENAYGDDTQRRVISQRVSVGLPAC
jgi:type IV pilus assembly protein PilV